MLSLLLLLSLMASATLAAFPADCSNSPSKSCLSYDEVGAIYPGYQSYFIEPKAPCTTSFNMCFTSVSPGGGASLGSCHSESTRPECWGVACDTSSVPVHPNCASDQTTYCKCPFKKHDEWHTMCLYCGMGPLCLEVDGYRGVTSAMETEIVDAHNTFRSWIARGQEDLGDFSLGGYDDSTGVKRQPKAANMRRLSWDSELARVAQRWADQCQSRTHDKARGTNDFPAGAGQNMGYVSTSSKTLAFNATRIVEAWYLEVADWPPTYLNSFSLSVPSGKVIGHFTQLAWAETYKVGCGYTQFKHSDGFFHQFLVCNYGPSGNWNGNQVYQSTTGTPGHDCPTSPTVQPPNNVVDGLCVLP